ncbi:chemotaxis-specific protein-glutamate methyltransferase CheB [Azospirillum sp.]|uniref:chemotaxis-specific protein-glutamate methyltransferase CheB n=1 Tax=Azospirillum sp. TaxID=34012 RepID=UPI002D2F9E62|nr:chemotaxis-specific protein-glutamate methyltransferase CheB [Azospirillum sp.]HYF88403.1 chemotaxis-specific protein-glutamate methyltransferase CheB [Azospirillum sp.]
MVKLLIVDDSALMRRCLREIFEAEADFEVALARNGRDALEQIEGFRPDVVTLDVNMPEMDGLTCLGEIMAREPRPVVMVSSLTAEGAEVTLEALALGAVDVIQKPDGTVSLHINRIRHDLVAKVRAAAGARVRRARTLARRLREQSGRPGPAKSLPAREPLPPLRTATQGLILIGVSTGGPRTLEEVLPRLPAELPWPVLVAQHMPGAFTGVFAQRMNSVCALDVVEVGKPTALQPGRVYIARGDADMVVETRLGRLTAVPVPSDEAHLWHPSVARLVDSAMRQLPADRLIGVMLTGMGNDGAAAMAELRRLGGRTIAEDESTAVVFGMPADLIRRGGADAVLPCGDIATQLLRWLS